MDRAIVRCKAACRLGTSVLHRIGACLLVLFYLQNQHAFSDNVKLRYKPIRAATLLVTKVLSDAICASLTLYV